MASPAEIGNDMAAHAIYWERRDRIIEGICRDAARMIRDLLAGKPVDGRRYGGLHRRLLNLEDSVRLKNLQGAPDLVRARLAIEGLRRKVPN